MTIVTSRRMRAAAAFAILFLLYQSAEGVGARWLGSQAVQYGLMLAAFLSLWPLAWLTGNRGLRAYGLRSPSALALVASGLLLALLAKGAAIAFGAAAGLAEPVSPTPMAGVTSGAVFVGMTLISTFVPSLVEDVLTRGFLLETFDVRWTGPAFVLASAALFTVNHIYRFEAGWSEQARLLCCGLAYGAAAWRFRNLWAAVGLHWGYNLANEVWGRFSPLALPGDDAGRLLTAGLHLILLALVVSWPRGDGQIPAYHSYPRSSQ